MDKAVKVINYSMGGGDASTSHHWRQFQRLRQLAAHEAVSMNL